MINKIKRLLSKNACRECDYYRGNGICQSKKVATSGCHPHVNWIDRYFCRPYKGINK